MPNEQFFVSKNQSRVIILEYSLQHWLRPYVSKIVRMTRLFFITSLAFLMTVFNTKGQVYTLQEGVIYFISDAPLETIEARSVGLKGVIDSKERTFAFSIDVDSFNGFKNPLQKTHFNEAYMESTQHQEASFIGKIIEKTDFSQDGEYVLRAKGKLKIHGIEQERIIRSRVVSKNGVLQLNAFFTIFLNEYDIMIPKIVQQKISEEIQVSVRAALLCN